MLHTNAPVDNVYDFKYVGSVSKRFILILYSLYKWICIKTNHCQSVSKLSRLYLYYSCETIGLLLNLLSGYYKHNEHHSLSAGVVDRFNC